MNTAQQKLIGADVKKLLERRSQPAGTLMDTSVRAEEKFEEEPPELPDYEKSFFGEVTSLGAFEEVKHEELPPDLISPEAKFKKY